MTPKAGETENNMAQAKVTNFFKIRKGSDIVHPSKRSKLDIEEQISHAAVEEKCKEPEAAKQLKKVSVMLMFAGSNLNAPGVNKRGGSRGPD